MGFCDKIISMGNNMEISASAPPAYTELPNEASSSTNVNHSYRDIIISKINKNIENNKLQYFYNKENILPIIERLVVIDWNNLAKRWKVNIDIITDLCQLALYDSIIYIDDSGSMSYEEEGSRIEDATKILEKISEITTLFDDDGLNVRFINSSIEGNSITTKDQIKDLISQIKFSGATPIGTNLEKKIIKPFAIKTKLNKPLLIFIVTDGCPSSEENDNNNKLANVISETRKMSIEKYHTSKAISYMITQVGNDRKAKEFVANIDDNKEYGDVVDSLINYEAEELLLKSKNIVLTPELYLIKMMLGAIDISYDMDN